MAITPILLRLLADPHRLTVTSILDQFIPDAFNLPFKTLATFHGPLFFLDDVFFLPRITLISLLIIYVR